MSFNFLSWLRSARQTTVARPHRGKSIVWRGNVIKLRKGARTLKAANLNLALARAQDADFMIKYLNPRHLRVVA